MNTAHPSIVVKIGGAEGLDLPAALDDIAHISEQQSIVVVHGVSAKMNQLCAERGVKIRTLTSPTGHFSRHTPPEIRDIYVEAAEAANHEIVQGLLERNVKAISFAGDKVAIKAARKSAIRAVERGRIRVIRDDHSGYIQSVDAPALQDALNSNLVPVVPPMAKSEISGFLNVDGDRAAAAVASAVNAVSQVIVSNVDGLYRQFPDPETLVSLVPYNELEDALLWAQGRMKRKVLAATEAIEGGVEQVIITNGRIANAISNSLQGLGGTVFRGRLSDDD